MSLFAANDTVFAAKTRVCRHRVRTSPAFTVHRARSTSTSFSRPDLLFIHSSDQGFLTRKRAFACQTAVNICILTRIVPFACQNACYPVAGSWFLPGNLPSGHKKAVICGRSPAYLPPDHKKAVCCGRSELFLPSCHKTSALCGRSPTALPRLKPGRGDRMGLIPRRLCGRRWLRGRRCRRRRGRHL